MDLIRELMLKLEELPVPTAGMVVVDATKKRFQKEFAGAVNP
ncbi:DUF2513 domain-containing protein [Paraburkholderia diazotrophica]|nr:DUF2513 domain-containing protein [Paraburkholderia diazotrophica]